MRLLGYRILSPVVAVIGLYLLSRRVTQATRPATDFALDQTTPQGTLRMFFAAVASKDLDAMVAVIPEKPDPVDSRVAAIRLPYVAMTP